MSALLSIFDGGTWAVIAGVAGAFLLGLWRLLAGAKKAGRNEQIAREAEARNENIKRLKQAIDAGNQHPLGGVPDKHDRDNR